MKIKIALLSILITIICCSASSCLFKTQDSIYIPPSTPAQEAVVISPRSSPMFISLRFQHIGPESVQGIENITADKFEECLKYLCDNNYHFMSTKEVYDFVVNKVPVPYNSVWLTFDDTMESSYSCAAPLLKKYNARATVFVGIAWIRKPYRLTNNELIKMSKSGVWDIQTHGYTGNLSFPINNKGAEGNFYLNRLWQIDRSETPDEYKDRIKKDLNDAFKYIKENFNSEKLMFAYPFSENLKDIRNKNSRVRLLLECLDELNIIGIGKKEGSSIVNDWSTERHFISRFDVDEYIDLDIILSPRYTGNMSVYAGQKGNMIRFNNIIRFDQNSYICWDNKYNFMLTDKDFKPLGSPINLSGIFNSSSNKRSDNSPVLVTSYSENSMAMVDIRNKSLIFINKNWTEEDRYSLGFTPASIWSKENEIYLMDAKGNIYQFSNKPNLIFRIGINFKSPIKACAYENNLYIIDDEKKTIYIVDYVQRKLTATKPYSKNYSIVPQLCININEFIAWDIDNNVFVNVKIK